MGPISRSLRWQIQLWHGATLSIVVAGLLTLGYWYESRRQEIRLDVQIQQFVPPVLSEFGRGHRGGEGGGRRRPPPRDEWDRGPDDRPDSPDQPERKLPDGMYYHVWDRSGRLLRSSEDAPEIPYPNRQLKPTEYEYRNRETMRELLTFVPGDGLLLIGTSRKASEVFLQKLAWQLGLLGGGIVVFGLAGGWWLTDRALRPLSDIGRTAEEIASGDLNKRIEVGKASQEVAQLAAVLNQTFARLQDAFAQQVRFSSDASHELRTPLSVILAQTQLALSKQRSAVEYQKALEICRRHAEMMRNLVNSLLELAHMDSVRDSLHLQNTDLAALAEETVRLLQAFAQEKGVRLVFAGGKGEYRMDPEKMRRVLVNLISNAIIYNKPGGEVRVIVRGEAGGAEFEVVDTGIGIEAKHLPYLFDRFYRTDKSRSRAFGGTGLGLAICRTFVEAHGGSIQVESEPEVGSRFIVNLPAIP